MDARLRPFKLAAPRVREAAIQDQIIDYLRAEQARGRVVWIMRLNSGAKNTGGRWIANYRVFLPGIVGSVSKGMPDILVLLPDGKLAMLEVKADGGNITEEQLHILQISRDRNCIAQIVRRWEDVRDALFGGGGCVNMVAPDSCDQQLSGT
jgi:hypothetical protein